MICFCEEIWVSSKKGAITGVGNSFECSLYLVIGNKRVRAERIIEWEREYMKTYPRLRFITTKSLNDLKKSRWIKCDCLTRLIPYRCT